MDVVLATTTFLSNSSYYIRGNNCRIETIQNLELKSNEGLRQISVINQCRREIKVYAVLQHHNDGK